MNVNLAPGLSNPQNINDVVPISVVSTDVNLAPGLSNSTNINNIVSNNVNVVPSNVDLVPNVDNNNNNVNMPMNNQNNTLELGQVENSKNNLGTNNLNEFQDWRSVFFEKLDCKGAVINAGNGDVVVQGEIKSNTSDPTIMYWAPNPPTWSQSFSGSGLPYHDSIQAYENSPNIGAVKAVNRKFEFRIQFPNAYYVGLGSLYVPPVIHFKICEDGKEQKEYHTIELGKGIPFRTLTHPAPPSNKPRDSPLFYHCTNKLPVRTQEQVLRDSGYPEDNRMPDDFWGLKPPL